MTTNVETASGSVVCWSRTTIYIEAQSKVTALCASITSKFLDGGGPSVEDREAFTAAQTELKAAKALFDEVRDWAIHPAAGFALIKGGK